MSTRNTDLILSLRAVSPFPDAVSEIISGIVVDEQYDEFKNTVEYIYI